MINSKNSLWFNKLHCLKMTILLETWFNFSNKITYCYLEQLLFRTIFKFALQFMIFSSVSFFIICFCKEFSGPQVYPIGHLIYPLWCMSFSYHIEICRYLLWKFIFYPSENINIERCNNRFNSSKHPNFWMFF